MFKLISRPLVWAFSKCRKLPLWGLMTIFLVIAAAVILLMTVSFGHKAQFMTTAMTAGELVVGPGDTHRIAAGDALRLLAVEGKTFWTETPDGRFRGYLSPEVVGSPQGLPKRYRYQDRKMSYRKYRTMIDEPGFSLQQFCNRVTVNCVKTTADSVVVIPNILLYDDRGDRFAPSLRFRPDGALVETNYRPVRSGWFAAGDASAKPFLDQNDGSTRLVDLFSFLISRPEFPALSPSNWLLSAIFQFLVAFLPLGILVLLLACRKPLYYLPNWSVDLLIVLFLFYTPYLWVRLMVLRGYSAWVVYPVVGVLALALAFLFLTVYRGLRCPRCKRLERHEVVRSEVVGHKYKKRKGETVISRTPTQTKTGYTVTSRNGVEEGREKDWEEKHYDEAVDTWVDRVRIDKIKELCRCRHCGHERTRTRREEVWLSREDTGSEVRKTSDFRRF